MAEIPIAEVVDRLAQDPSPRIFASIQPPSGSRRDINYREFSNLVNTAALWLDQHLQTHSRTFAYIGSKDLCRMALLMACTKSDWRILMIRRYASWEAMEHLVNASDCHSFLYDDEEKDSDAMARLTTQYPERSHIILPSWESWLSLPTQVDYIPIKPWKETLDDDVCVYHTSGTTSVPKPIVWTNRRIAKHAKLSYLDDQMNLSGKRIVSTFPSSHVGGAGLSLFFCIYLGMIPVFPETSVPLDPQDVIDLLESGKGDILCAQPSLLTAITRSEMFLSRLHKLDYIFTGSAPLSKREVDIMQGNGGPLVFNIYSSTEIWPTPQTAPHRGDYPYVAFPPQAGIAFHKEQDNLYELVIEKQGDEKSMQSVFSTFPGIKSYRTEDLFSPHPSKEGYWRYSGRRDDMLSLATGQGINVGPMERVIMECPLVDTAIIGDDGRPASILLVVPHAQPDTERDYEHLQHTLWPFIEEANALCHPAGAIQKQMVLVLPTRERLTSTTEKGTLNRRQTLIDFQDRINEVYERA